MDIAEAPNFRVLYDTIVAAGASNLRGDPDVQRRGEQARAELFAYVTPLIHQRREHPGDDLLSVLCSTEYEGVRLSDDELASFCSFLLAAGVETTDRALSSLFSLLWQHPDQWRLLAGRRDLLKSACAEGLRLSPPVHALSRGVRADAELSGQRFAEGDRVVVLMGAANRDPDVFADPDRFDVTRFEESPDRQFGAKAQILSFGFGTHLCTGSQLAKLEIVESLDLFLDRFEEPRFADGQAPDERGYVLRSPAHLPRRPVTGGRARRYDGPWVVARLARRPRRPLRRRDGGHHCRRRRAAATRTSPTPPPVWPAHSRRSGSQPATGWPRCSTRRRPTSGRGSGARGAGRSRFPSTPTSRASSSSTCSARAEHRCSWRSRGGWSVWPASTCRRCVTCWRSTPRPARPGGSGRSTWSRSTMPWGRRRRTRWSNRAELDPVYVMYTSGTSGPSKGAIHSNRSALWNAYAWLDVLGLDDDTVAYSMFPLFHVTARSAVVTSTLWAGGVALRPGFSVSGFWSDVTSSGATFFAYMGSVIHLLWSAPPSALDREHHVRVAFGAAAPPELVERFEERFGVRLIEVYGSTELGLAERAAVR